MARSRPPSWIRRKPGGGRYKQQSCQVYKLDSDSSRGSPAYYLFKPRLLLTINGTILPIHCTHTSTVYPSLDFYRKNGLTYALTGV